MKSSALMGFGVKLCGKLIFGDLENDTGEAKELLTMLSASFKEASVDRQWHTPESAWKTFTHLGLFEGYSANGRGLIGSSRTYLCRGFPSAFGDVSAQKMFKHIDVGIFLDISM